ncbi:CLUMA_CG013639, isoform A [Clunio marinus]|uniref:CLUMA_CG013639, isoform A n=1 Tax=Clunio marinus TaxID=568069 RepID=A0A1J1IJG5_9DIPT|nr:CLUMA_CG013639, isoform A [Clunio marinus]
MSQQSLMNSSRLLATALTICYEKLARKLFPTNLLLIKKNIDRKLLHSKTKLIVRSSFEVKSWERIVVKKLLKIEIKRYPKSLNQFGMPPQLNNNVKKLPPLERNSGSITSSNGSTSPKKMTNGWNIAKEKLTGRVPTFDI